MISLAKVQKTFTRTLPGMKCFSYEKRLDNLSLISLEQRKLRNVRIEVHIIIIGKIVGKQQEKQ